MHKNLKIDWIDGIMFEDAEMTELKVRQFLQDTLELPDVLTMPFEYSFRIKRSLLFDFCYARTETWYLKRLLKVKR